MKRVFPTVLLFLMSSFIAYSAPKYWVGPSNGNWSDKANWSNVSNGVGGAEIPGTLDSVIFNASYALVHVDVSPTIGALRIEGNFLGPDKNVTLYASTAVVFTLLGPLNISRHAILKDSTSADVPFNFVLNGVNLASSNVQGQWVFEGGVPVTPSGGNGAGFTVEPGSRLTITGTNPLSYPRDGWIRLASVIFKKNTNYISSNSSSLTFAAGSMYILENNEDATIPNAFWADEPYLSPTSPRLLPKAQIRITGKMGKLLHLATVPSYRNIFVDLPDQMTDASLNLPDGTFIDGNLDILNTNNQSLSLLAPTGPSSSVKVGMSVSSSSADPPGGLNIAGNSKVALATATSAAPGTSYYLSVYSYNQTGGNFSLQDYNDPTGSSVLTVQGYLSQTGGTFITNSTTTNSTAKFIVDLIGPFYYTGGKNSVPPYSISPNIRMSGGNLDNPNHMVTLRISLTKPMIPGVPVRGVDLLSPLSVGKLEIVKGTLNTSGTNILTVTNPDPSAILIGTKDSSYVNGPMRRWTNSTSSYFFPTGKGTFGSRFHFDSCMVIPTSAAPSLYQAEHFDTSYSDLSVSTPLKGVSNAEYWNILKISGADANVKLVVNAPVPGAINTDGLVIARYATDHWVAENGSVLTPGNTVTGSVTSKTLSSFGPLTFGYGDSANLQQQASGGLNYKYYEGFFNMLPDFSTLTPVKTGTSANIDLGIRRTGVNDSFAITWEGYINIPTPGTYTFETISDDGSKLYFNGQVLVNNDGTHPPQSATGTVNIPTAGKYPIIISFFENYGGEGMQVYWSGPGISRQVIPDAAFAEGASQPPVSGLNFKYYEGFFNMLPDFSTLSPLKTGNSPNIDLGIRRSGVNDSFAIVWEGSINIQMAGNYTFETISDDGSKMYFNGQTLVNNDGTHPPQSVTGTVNIPVAGKYPITISYFENYGGEGLQVYWSGPGFARQLIPDAAFADGANPPVSSGLDYKYYEGDFNSLPDFNTLTPLKTGKSGNVDLSVRPTGVNDHFALKWEGYISIPSSGNYTFETVSDDGSKLYFNSAYSANGTPLVNNDGLHAAWPATGTVTIGAAGTYPITITYFDKDGGETMQLYWTGPGFERQLIPDEAFGTSIPQPASGLDYKYYEGDFNSLPDFSSMTPVKTGKGPNVDIAVRPAGKNDHFAFMWEGYITIPVSGSYTFETISDDGSKLYFNSLYSPNGTALVNSDGLHAPWSASGTVTIAAGTYPIAITYFEKDGGETMEVYWTGPGIERQRIPDAAFNSSNAAVVSSTNGIRAGNIIGEMKNGDVKIYPNPFTENFILDYYHIGSVSGKASISVFDLNGRLMYQYQPANLVQGFNRWVINSGDKKIKPGVYIAQINVNGLPAKSIKLVKAK